MDILLVDDEPLARERLKKLLQDLPECRLVGEAENGDEALTLIMAEDPDLVLLDIRMPGPSGMEVAKQISELEDPPAIIFCSAYDEYALEAFGVHAVGYLLKPVRGEDLKAVIDKAASMNRLQRRSQQTDESPVPQRQHISAKTHRGLELIEIDSIRYFSADQKYVTVIHAGGETLIDDTLKELETLLGSRFVRVHRNALVAKKYILALEKSQEGGYHLRLEGCERKPAVSRRHLSSVKQLLQNL
ncbi:LytTR family DNA-binding domain-containing protein [Halioxenophilus sp. WMMB6]|uniref:LytR/AlgR family response regulator transcription factor n=1 Tax=Halioxenophilus sp. WMMB6 TaxID=3073815 RepID=UPI00295ECE9D|nr:LytTR family DNA-binding domain-containing protein [Halioxenophilus sp. WMMB6]